MTRTPKAATARKGKSKGAAEEADPVKGEAIDRAGRMSQPIRRVLFRIRCGSGGGHPSRPHVAARLKRPTRALDGKPHRALSGLAPGGACRAASVARSAVVSYTAVSPLPLARRFVFCGAFPRVTPGGCYPPPFPVEPGRSSWTRPKPAHAAAWPTHSQKESYPESPRQPIQQRRRPPQPSSPRPFHTPGRRPPQLPDRGPAKEPNPSPI